MNLFSGYHRRKRCFLSNLRSVLPTRQFGGVISTETSQVCNIMVYQSNWLRKHWQTIIFLEKYWKHDHTMILIRIMKNMVITLWSWYASWPSCQETWPSCRHHGMIMVLFRHDRGMIMPRSWQNHDVVDMARTWVTSQDLANILSRIFKGMCFSSTRVWS